MRSPLTSSGILLALMLSVALPACSSSGSGDADGGKMTSAGSGSGASSGGSGGTTGGGGASGPGTGVGGAAGSHAGSSGGDSGGDGVQPGGGAGGNAGGAGGHAGGAGGHGGGGGADPLDQACTSACAMQAGLSCQDATCHDDCLTDASSSTGTGQSCKSQYTALLECEAKLPAGAWICSSDEDVPEVADGQCMATLCAWACCVSSLITTSDVWSRCLPVCG
jgi:hypothetical protein